MGPDAGVRGEGSTDADAAVDRSHCEWCVEHPSRPCPACNARRRRAVRLVEGNGLSVDEAAYQMHLPVARVERLLEDEADRRAVAQFRQTHVENAPLREKFLAQRRNDPALTVVEIAGRVGT